MPFNGSGTFTVAEAPFVPNTPISSADMNSNFDDIADNGLSNVLTLDGQKAMSAALPLANAGATFGTDPDTGIKRLGANNGSLFAGGTDALTWTAIGVAVPGTLGVTGVASFADGTVLLPGVTFTSDPDSGLYHIAANNIGVAVNAAKVLDIATTGLGVTGLISSTTTITAGTALVATTSVTAGNGLTVTAGTVAFPAGAYAVQASMETPSSATLFVNPSVVKYHPGVVKGWGRVTMSAGAPVLTQGNNISGTITDNGAGDFSFTFTSALADGNYAVVGSAYGNALSIFRLNSASAPATTGFRVLLTDAGGTPTDPTGFSFVVMGDF